MAEQNPEINSSFRPPESKTPEAVMAWLAQQGRANELSALQKASDFVDSIQGIDRIEKLTSVNELPEKVREAGLTVEDVKEEARERLRQRYEDFVVAQLGPISEIEDDFDRLHQEVPWESRYGEQTYGTAVQLIDNALRKTRRVEKEEDKVVEVAFLKEMKSTALWAQGLFQVLEGSATSIDTYFAGEDQIRQLLTTHIKITETAFEKTFARRLPGLELNKEQRDRFKRYFTEDNKKKPELPGLEQGTVDRDRSKGKEFGVGVESLRDLVTQFQDDRMRLAITIAEVQQEDFENPPSSKPALGPRERDAMYIDERTRHFVYEVFGVRNEDKSGNKGETKLVTWIDKNGVTHIVPEKILNYYNMSTTDKNKKEYKALMQASLSLDALRRLNEGEDIVALGQEVRQRADEMLDNFYAEEKFSVREKLAGLITKAGIDMDTGLMACGELGWGWTYEKFRWSGLSPGEQTQFANLKQSGEEVVWADLSDSEKQEYLKSHPGEDQKKSIDKVILEDFVVFRTSDTGSIYAAADTWSPMYPDYHVWVYQGNSETTSQLMPATPHDFRMEAMTHKPDWRPPIENYISYNPTLRKMLYKLFKGNFKDEEITHDMKYGELDPRVIDYMKKNKKAWVSWPTFGKDEKGKEKRFAIPMFFPSAWLSLNFWRAICEDGKDAIVAPSLWEKFKEGMKLSDVPYPKYKDLVVDWTNVNRSQFARVIMMTFLPHKMSRDIMQEYEKFFPEEGTSSDAIKELAKRIRLGTRGEPAEMGVIEIAMIPALYSLHLYKKHNLFRAFSEPLGGQNIEEGWRQEISKWQVEMANLPPQKGLKRNAIKNYGKSMAVLMEFYTPIFLECAKLTASMIGNQNIERDYRLKNSLKKVSTMQDIDSKDVMGVL